MTGTGFLQKTCHIMTARQRKTETETGWGDAPGRGGKTVDFLVILKLGATFSLIVFLCAALFHVWTELSVRLISLLKRFFRFVFRRSRRT